MKMQEKKMSGVGPVGDGGRGLGWGLVEGEGVGW